MLPYFMWLCIPGHCLVCIYCVHGVTRPGYINFSNVCKKRLECIYAAIMCISSKCESLVIQYTVQSTVLGLVFTQLGSCGLFISCMDC